MKTMTCSPLRKSVVQEACRGLLIDADKTSGRQPIRIYAIHDRGDGFEFVRAELRFLNPNTTRFAVGSFAINLADCAGNLIRGTGERESYGPQIQFSASRGSTPAIANFRAACAIQS